MNVYIWNNPYHVSYGGSFLFAVAENEEKARAQAAKGYLSYYGMEPEKEIMTKATNALGEPDRVISAPYAEWYEWSE